MTADESTYHDRLAVSGERREAKRGDMMAKVSARFRAGTLGFRQPNDSHRDRLLYRAPHPPSRIGDHGEVELRRLLPPVGQVAGDAAQRGRSRAGGQVTGIVDCVLTGSSSNQASRIARRRHNAQFPDDP
jgi:hypothetical protein